MPKETPEQQAARLTKRMRDARNTAAVMVVDGHFGRAMFAMFAKADVVTREEVLAAFERALADEPAGSVERVQAEEVIRRLRAREMPR